jgi:hypothetical protein
MIMKLIISALLAMVVLGGVAARASADEYNPYQEPQQDRHRNFGL